MPHGISDEEYETTDIDGLYDHECNCVGNDMAPGCNHDGTRQEWGPKMDKASANDYKMVCELLMYHMDMKTRRILMNELPGAYNRIHGYEIVKVTRTSDNTRIGGN